LNLQYDVQLSTAAFYSNLGRHTQALLQKRLLVPVVVAASCSWFNSLAGCWRLSVSQPELTPPMVSSAPLEPTLWKLRSTHGGRIAPLIIRMSRAKSFGIPHVVTRKSGGKRLKLQYDESLSNFAFSLRLRRYTLDAPFDFNYGVVLAGRGLHSSTFQLNLSHF